MHYTEWYEVYNTRTSPMLLGKFDTEQEALALMDTVASTSLSGAWRVIRVSEVTIATQSKA